MELTQIDFNSIGVVGIVVLFGFLLATGRIATGRELRDKEKRIVRLEEALRVRDQQLNLVLTETMTTISPALRAIRDAYIAGTTDPGGLEDGP